eukprot:jgi/Chlat1/4881/Chrsp31S04899
MLPLDTGHSFCVERSLAWDLDNDNVCNDATGHNPTFNAYDQGLAVGIHPISVRSMTSSSTSSCPNNNSEVMSTTVNVTNLPLAINSLATYANSGNGVASVEERIRSVRASCAPFNMTIDRGSDSVGNEAGCCRYSSPAGGGIKTITATVASSSRNITVASFYMGGPYSVDVCSGMRPVAPVTINACGHPRRLAWDFNNDGLSSDATGSAPYLFNSIVQLPPAINSISKRPVSNNPIPTTREDIAIVVSWTAIYCLPYTVNVDCGPDNVSQRPLFCRYKTLGQKTITATLTQYGVSLSRSLKLTVAAYYIGGPYRVPLCGSILVHATGASTSARKCKKTWPGIFHGDGAFNDATGQQPRFDTFGLRPGLYPISVRASSSNTTFCPNAVPVIFTTNATIAGSILPPGNKTCYFQHDTSGVKLIMVTLSEEGVEVFRSLNVTIITIAPSCNGGILEEKSAW